MQIVFTGTMTFPFGLLSAPLTYDAPTLLDLVTQVRQDLRDPNPENGVFSDAEVRDLIKFGFNEVSRIYPKEITDSFLLDATTRFAREFPTFATDPFRVEIIRANGAIGTLERNAGEDSQDGWDVFGDIVSLPNNTFLKTGDILRIWGYARRFPPTNDEEPCDVDADAAQAIRQYAALTGLGRLVAQRTLYTQWNQLPGNTDTSLGQLTTLSSFYAQQWTETRKRLKTLRRVA